MWPTELSQSTMNKTLRFQKMSDFKLNDFFKQYLTSIRKKLTRVNMTTRSK